MMSRSEQWLAYLADPDGLNRRWTPPPFARSAPADLTALLELAHRHNVRPALSGNLQALLQSDPLRIMAHDDTPGLKSVLAAISEARLLDVGRAVLLAQTGEIILEAVVRENLPAVLVKGADFAKAAYGGLQRRTFSDIDILCRPDVETELGRILASQGFEALAPKASRESHTERVWIRRDRGPVHVEVHTDVVHAPELRSAQTLTWQLYAAPENGGVTPAARLMLAALHGATSHLFGRLQYVVDGLMVGRMGVDPKELAERAKRSGAQLATFTMLRLAAELFVFEEAQNLMHAVMPSGLTAIERHLITSRSVLGGKGHHRWRLLPQRYLYRRLLRM